MNINKQPTGDLTSDFDSSLSLDISDDMNMKFLLLHVQITYMTGDCLTKWLIMLGFMDLRWLRVCQCSTSVLLYSINRNQIQRNCSTNI